MRKSEKTENEHPGFDRFDPVRCDSIRLTVEIARCAVLLSVCHKSASLSFRFHPSFFPLALLRSSPSSLLLLLLLLKSHAATPNSFS